MSSISISRKHSVPVDELRKRVEAALGPAARDFGLAVAWPSAHEATARRAGVDGKIVCGESSVDVEVELTGFARLIKGPIRTRLEAMVETLIA